MPGSFLPRARAVSASILLVVLSSCSTADTVSGPAQQTPSLLADRGHLGPHADLLPCPGTPEAAAEQAIGPEGGTLKIGPHRLVIPAGALDSVVLISAVAAADSVVSVQFAPEGLTFSTPAHLTLSYGACPFVSSLLPKSVVYTTDALELLELLLSADDEAHEKVSADLDHFSRYAVAW